MCDEVISEFYDSYSCDECNFYVKNNDDTIMQLDFYEKQLQVKRPQSGASSRNTTPNVLSPSVARLMQRGITPNTPAGRRVTSTGLPGIIRFKQVDCFKSTLQVPNSALSRQRTVHMLHVVKFRLASRLLLLPPSL